MLYPLRYEGGISSDRSARKSHLSLRPYRSGI